MALAKNWGITMLTPAKTWRYYNFDTGHKMAVNIKLNAIYTSSDVNMHFFGCTSVI